MLKKIAAILLCCVATAFVGCRRATNDQSAETLNKQVEENSDVADETPDIEVEEKSDEPDIDQTNGNKGKSEIEATINEAFEVWKALDQRIWMMFSTTENLTSSDLVTIYSRYCVNTSAKDNLITITKENASDELKNYIGGTYFKRDGFQEFFRKYFRVDVDDFTDMSSYIPELDAFMLTPTPPVPIEIILKDYDMDDEHIQLIVDYNDNQFQSYQECRVMVVMTEGGFYFDSCDLLFDSDDR